MTLALTLPALTPEQIDIFGSTTVLLGGWAAPEPATPEGPAPGLDQLNFVASQEPLSETPPVARQLPLLPDPPPWEEQPAEPARRPRARRTGSARRRSPAALSPGQMSLF